MFDISFGEISIVGLVALLVLGPKDMLALFKNIKKITANIKSEVSKYMKEIHDAIEDEEIVDVVIDDEGKPQKAYKLDKIMPYIKDKDE